MKIAVIADIHGNDLALEAVLADIAAQGIDDVINLGDHLSGPMNAARTADILMARNFPSIRGNHDRWLVSLKPAEMGQSDRMAHAELQPQHLDWLRALPPTLVHRQELFLCHATPQDDLSYWLEDLTADGVVHMSGRKRIEGFAEGIDFPVILCGHTHIPRAVRLSDGRLVVNPGSVGCPGYDDDEPVFHKVETGSPDASYAVLEKVKGRWNVTFRRVSYDHMAMSNLARKRGRDGWANALATGWVD
ncbi:metallophosphatase family protein [Pararhizobium sp. YC-54]|uniref:metallophosphoesterase family protein n=1 Tax=Pararhizobium sp. YC-54 TaxID=2986920 RepID=UPI0021F6E4BF|nr:metallophosphatase family protein [Pararhizobium sp. YC-54]MCV9997475.1 metallophosphatase family protein [Pararhizobium sp. YC-54]